MKKGSLDGTAAINELVLQSRIINFIKCTYELTMISQDL